MQRCLRNALFPNAILYIFVKPFSHNIRSISTSSDNFKYAVQNRQSSFLQVTLNHRIGLRMEELDY